MLIIKNSIDEINIKNQRNIRIRTLFKDSYFINNAIGIMTLLISIVTMIMQIELELTV